MTTSISSQLFVSKLHQSCVKVSTKFCSNCVKALFKLCQSFLKVGCVKIMSKFAVKKSYLGGYVLEFWRQNCTFLSLVAYWSLTGQYFTHQVSYRFPDMRVPKLLLPPLKKIRIFSPKTSKFGQKFVFFVVLGQIFSFLVQCGAIARRGKIMS